MSLSLFFIFIHNNKIFSLKNNVKQKSFFLLVLAPLWIFSQCIEGDCQNGQGEYKFKNGTYIGEFVDGELSGAGVFSNKKGYTYNGEWKGGEKHGVGLEFSKKGFSYEGEFRNNQRHGSGKATFRNTKSMQNIEYDGEWLNGSLCGKGQLTYQREVKYGRNKEVEVNNLTGLFFNGVYQGGMTSAYSDELMWDLTTPLKSEYFQKPGDRLSEKDLKRKKNLATLEGSIFVSCECRSGFLIFDANAVFRQDRSWWYSGVPVKTKSIILNTMQGEFDIIEWYARELKNDLNKEQFSCNTESLSLARSLIESKTKEVGSVRKTYIDETRWNPAKGGLKNSRIQQKWDKKILKKLNKLDKLNEKSLSKLEKKIEKSMLDNCPTYPVDINLSPIKRINNKNIETSGLELVAENRNTGKSAEKEVKEEAKKQKRVEKAEKEKALKEEKRKREEDSKIKAKMKADQKQQDAKERAEKKQAKKIKRAQRSYEPQFPRAKQLE